MVNMTGKASIAGVPIGIVKGGTTSAAYDREMEARKQDAERRRAHQDQVRSIGTTHKHVDDLARLGSTQLVGTDSPRLVLHYMNADGSIRQDCKAELTMVPKRDDPTKLEMMFAMVCPRCVERGVAQGESQMMIRESHRKFHVDERTKGQVVMLEYAWGLRERVIIAGTVSVDDEVKCDNYNCTFKCRIDQSKVWEK